MPVLRVVIADDEALVVFAMQCAVESCGHTVVGVAHTGLEAVELCRRERPDLVLMDVRMPGMDGLAATRALMEERPVPVVIVTGNSTMAQPAEAAGAMHCVVKPLDACRVPELIATACERFARFTVVRQEHHDAQEAVRAWVLTQQAVRGLASTVVSEQQAFANLGEMARARGLRLHQIAETLVAQAPR